MIRQTGGDIEESFLARRLPMGDCGFDQMTRTIELMQVAKIFEAMTWTPSKDMAVEVAVRLLGAREELNRSLD